MVGLAQPMPKKVSRSQLDPQLDRARNQGNSIELQLDRGLLEHSGAYGTQGAWRDLAHGSSSTGYAKEEGRSHLEDQLDRPLDRPSFNSIELEVKVKPEKCCFPLDFL
ncbi:unnamed protein product [Microthlaspi erraticum]|uniref:Uncharacterized protein n=1 Tax=Microthlaspi erraticum TaxID=1685480 RepID=A0A6D2I0Y1_9BRAS|nr:unnamed protein product [Microthlaspi erraticum]